MSWEIAVLYIYSYLIGAVPTAYLLARLVRGIDLRQYGSGNVGGSNIIRQLGKVWLAPLVLLEFLLKGLSPALIGQLFLAHLPAVDRTSAVFLAAPLLALIGNNWSVFLKFQGGRGLLVVCGILVALTPLLFLVGIAIYLVGWFLSRSSSAAALVAVASLPLLALLPGGVLVAGWLTLLSWAYGSGGISAPADVAYMISCYCLAMLAVVVVKRLLSNSLAFPDDLPRKKVLFNRLFRDRDVDNRAEWVSRIPDGAERRTGGPF